MLTYRREPIHESLPPIPYISLRRVVGEGLKERRERWGLLQYLFTAKNPPLSEWCVPYSALIGSGTDVLHEKDARGPTLNMRDLIGR